MHLAYSYRTRPSPQPAIPYLCYRDEIVAAIQAAMANDGAVSAIPRLPWAIRPAPVTPRQTLVLHSLPPRAAAPSRTNPTTSPP